VQTPESDVLTALTALTSLHFTASHSMLHA
jgi:hypothetical protein